MTGRRPEPQYVAIVEVAMRGETTGIAEHPIARLSWRAILAGAVSSVAVTWLLFTLAGAIGLTAIEPVNGIWMSPAGGVAMGILGVVGVAAGSFLGGLVAVRMSSITDRTDAVVQGLTTWALAFLFSAVVSSFFGVVSTTGAVIAEATAERAEVARDVTPAREAASRREVRRERQATLPTYGPTEQQATADLGAGVSWAVFGSGLAGALAAMAGGLYAVGGFRSPRRRMAEVVRPGEPAPLAP